MGKLFFILKHGPGAVHEKHELHKNRKQTFSESWFKFSEKSLDLWLDSHFKLWDYIRIFLKHPNTPFKTLTLLSRSVHYISSKLLISLLFHLPIITNTTEFGTEITSHQVVTEIKELSKNIDYLFTSQLKCYLCCMN